MKKQQANQAMIFKFPKLSPTLIVILPIAIFLDVTSWILLLFGMDDWGILDLLGIIFIDGWLLFKGGKGLTSSGKKKGLIDRLFTGKFSRFITPTTIELIPYIGAISPTWTIAVLKNAPRAEENESKETAPTEE